MGLYRSKGIKQANQTLNKWFSIYIRVRDAEAGGVVECITCETTGQWDDGFDAGHFVDYDKLPTRWNEYNAHTQCKRCNLSANGQQWKHGEAIKMLHGEDVLHELLEASEENVSITKAQRMEMAREFKQMAEDMASQKGIELKQ